MWVYFQSLYSLPLIHICFCASTMLFWLRSFVVLPEAWEGMLPGLFISFSISLAVLGLLWLHINFKIIFSSSVKNFMGNSIRIALNLQIALCSMAILTIFFQSNSMKYLPIFGKSSVSFIDVLQLCLYKSVTSQVRLIPNFFCCCDFKRIFLNFHISLLVLRNVTDLQKSCILLFC